MNSEQDISDDLEEESSERLEHLGQMIPVK
jgi:hypothetical protein